MTGRLPGVYQYSATNRATSGMVTRTVTIEGGTISGGVGVQLNHMYTQLMNTETPLQINDFMTIVMHYDVYLCH